MTESEFIDGVVARLTLLGFDAAAALGGLTVAGVRFSGCSVSSRSVRFGGHRFRVRRGGTVDFAKAAAVLVRAAAEELARQEQDRARQEREATALARRSEARRRALRYASDGPRRAWEEWHPTSDLRVWVGASERGMVLRIDDPALCEAIAEAVGLREYESLELSTEEGVDLLGSLKGEEGVVFDAEGGFSDGSRVQGPGSGGEDQAPGSVEEER